MPSAFTPPAGAVVPVGVLRARKNSLGVLPVEVLVSPQYVRNPKLKALPASRRYCEYAQVLVDHDGRPGRARREPRWVEVGAHRRNAVGAPLLLRGCSRVPKETEMVRRRVNEVGGNRCTAVLRHAAIRCNVYTYRCIYISRTCDRRGVQVIFDLHTLFLLSGVVTQARMIHCGSHTRTAMHAPPRRRACTTQAARTSRRLVIPRTHSWACSATPSWASGSGLSGNGLSGNGAKRIGAKRERR